MYRSQYEKLLLFFSDIVNINYCIQKSNIQIFIQFWNFSCGCICVCDQFLKLDSRTMTTTTKTFNRKIQQRLTHKKKEKFPSKAIIKLIKFFCVCVCLRVCSFMNVQFFVC